MNRRLVGKSGKKAVLGELVLPAARRELELVGRRLGNAARDDEPGLIGDIEHIALAKRAQDTRDAHGKERRAVLGKGARRAGIDGNPSVRRVAQGDPELAGCDVEPVCRRLKRVPTASPAARRTKGSGASPEQMTLGMPAVMRMRLARILVIIPPVPTDVEESPAAPMMFASILSTRGIKRAVGRAQGLRCRGRRCRRA